MKTIEEKAKAYDGAFERAKQIRNGNPSSGTAIVVCEQIFPELRESENNKMIRFIGNELACLRAHADGNHDRCVELNNALKWLYEQKEQKPTSFNEPYNPDEYEVVMEGNATSLKRKEQKPLSPEDKVKHPLYVEGFEAGKEVGRQYEKVFGEQKPADKDFPPLEGVDAIKAKYYDKGFKNGFDEGVDSVKPAEWSEEDEDAVRHICRYLGYHCNEATARGCTEWLNVRLKSLRPQPKQEWNEEDERKIRQLVALLKSSKEKFMAAFYKEIDECIAWVCDLRPSWKPSEQEKGALRTAISILTDEWSCPKVAAQLQNILNAFEGKESRKDWKPSEEQMKAFKGYIEDFQERAEAAVGGWNNFDVMIRLYEQLKKL